MANKIQVRRGLKANLPILAIGEPAFCTDTKELYIGTSTGNVKMSYDSSLSDYTKLIPYGNDTGTVNALVVSTPTITALTAGMAISIKVKNTTTGAVTLNWSSMGAKGVKTANDKDPKLVANGVYSFRYDGTNFILQGEGVDATDLINAANAILAM